MNRTVSGTDQKRFWTSRRAHNLRTAELEDSLVFLQPDPRPLREFFAATRLSFGLLNRASRPNPGTNYVAFLAGNSREQTALVPSETGMPQG